MQSVCAMQTVAAGSRPKAVVVGTRHLLAALGLPCPLWPYTFPNAAIDLAGNPVLSC